MAVNVSVSPIGATCAGIAGAILRPALIVPQLWPLLNGDQRHFVVMVSVAIGFSVGALAGLIGKPLISAIVGFSLALLAYFVTVWPMAACFCLTLLEQGESGEPPHWTLVGLTGALAGAAGGLAEQLSSRRSPGDRSQSETNSSPPTPSPTEPGESPDVSPPE